MESVKIFLDLPIATLVVLAAGYISYRFAFVGRNSSHTSIDTIFIAATFAAIAQGVNLLWKKNSFEEGCLQWLQEIPASGLMLGFWTSIITAILWRKWLEKWLFECLRNVNLLNTDRHKTAWLTYLARPPKNVYTQLYVRMKDGTCLLCDELHLFNKMDLGPAILGEDGSIMMYPTHRKANINDEWDLHPPPTKNDTAWGINLIYIPATEIAEIRVMHPFKLKNLAE